MAVEYDKSQEIILEIESSDKELAWDLLDTNELKEGAYIDLPGGAILTFKEQTTEKEGATAIVITFLISNLDKITTVADAIKWIYGKLKPKEKSIISTRIDHIEVEFEEEKIKKMVRTVIEQREDKK